MSKELPSHRQKSKDANEDRPRIILTDSFTDYEYLTYLKDKESNKIIDEKRSLVRKLARITTNNFLRSFDEFCALVFSILSIYGIYKLLEFLAAKDVSSIKLEALKYVVFFVECFLFVMYFWRVATKEHKDDE